MNKYFKFMTAALAVTALASCSEKLDFDQQGVSNVKESDMVATLMPFDMESSTRVGVQLDNQVVWAEDDEVRVYSLGKLTFNSYVLDENQPAGQGAGYATAVMKENNIQDKTSTNDYAVAQPKSNKDVRISSSENKNALLQAKIPSEYEWSTVQDAGVAYKVPSQYWGKVTSTKPFSCEFHALTSFIKLDLKDLPAGTQSIMITSHEDITFGPIEDPNDPGATVLKGGANEPLSGNFEAELIDKTSKLEASEDLNAKDYFRINFEPSDADEDKILFIPVIAQTYQKLYVIAVTEYGKSKYAIRDGEILKVWENEEFQVNVAKAVSLGAEIGYAGTSTAELSALIAQNYDGKHTVRVRVTGDLADGDIYIANNMDKDNVQITFAVPQNGDINIVEAKAQVAGWMTNFSDPYDYMAANPKENGAKARTVSLTFLQGATGAWAMYLPTSYVNINTMDDFGGELDILAAKSDASKPLSPARDLEVKQLIDEGLTANKAKDAPIVIHATNDAIITYSEVHVLPMSKASAVYVYGPETQLRRLSINTKTPGAVRLTDALVQAIAYEDEFYNAQAISINSNIYTDGSAAIMGLSGGTDKVQLQADWTGKALTPLAIAWGYDQAEVFTAAQLASLGTSTNQYEYIIADRVTDMWLGGKTYPWVGAFVAQLDADFAPVSPIQPVAPAFKLDGNSKALYNMYVSLDDPYFTDPHSCCTTCGSNEVKVEQDLGLVRGIYTQGTAEICNVRLNDALIDTKEYKIPNVGTLAGAIVADNHINLNNNVTTNVRVSNTGGRLDYNITYGEVFDRVGNAGGQVGFAWSTGGNIRLRSSKIEISKAETNVDETFVKTVGHNAGGFIGFAYAPNGTLTATSNSVKIDEVSAEKGSNVGGIAGQLNYQNTAGRIQKATVTIPVLKATELAKEQTSANHLNTVSGNNVGGLIGLMINETATANAFAIIGTVKVTVKDGVYANNQYAGGLVGKLQMLQDGMQDNGAETTTLGIGYTTTDVASAIDVNVTTLEAINGYAGGLVANNTGYVYVVNDYLGTGGETSTVDVTVGTLKTAFAGGGLFGENDDFIKVSAEPDGDHVNMTVNAWANTWPEARFGTMSYAEMSSSTLNKLCGTFAHGVGHQQTQFDIWPSHVNDNAKVLIDNKTKEKLFFKKHTDATNTTGDPDDPFWGDFWGYVGFSNKTGAYLIKGSNDHGDQYYNYRHAY